MAWGRDPSSSFVKATVTAPVELAGEFEGVIGLKPAQDGGPRKNERLGLGREVDGGVAVRLRGWRHREWSAPDGQGEVFEDADAVETPFVLG